MAPAAAATPKPAQRTCYALLQLDNCRIAQRHLLLCLLVLCGCVIGLQHKLVLLALQGANGLQADGSIELRVAGVPGLELQGLENPNRCGHV